MFLAVGMDLSMMAFYCRDGHPAMFLAWTNDDLGMVIPLTKMAHADHG